MPMGHARTVTQAPERWQCEISFHRIMFLISSAQRATECFGVSQSQPCLAGEGVWPSMEKYAIWKCPFKIELEIADRSVACTVCKLLF